MLLWLDYKMLMLKYNILLSSFYWWLSLYLLEENEVRTMVDPNSKNDRKLQELMKVSVQFFNSFISAIQGVETVLCSLSTLFPYHVTKDNIKGKNKLAF